MTVNKITRGWRQIKLKIKYVLIRIDCNYLSENRFQYIKQSILNSKLSILFDLDNVNFEYVDELSCGSLVIDIANYWNSGIKFYDELSKIVGMTRSTLRRYLQEACNKHFIELSYDEVLKEIRFASNKKLAITKGCSIICDQTGETFYSIAEAIRKTGVKNICKCLNGERSYAGKLSDGTKLTWTKLSNEQYEQMLLKRTS